MNQFSGPVAAMAPLWRQWFGGDLLLAEKPGGSEPGTISVELSHSGHHYGWLLASAPPSDGSLAASLLGHWAALMSRAEFEEGVSQELTETLMGAWDSLRLLHQVTQLMSTITEPKQLALASLRLVGDVIEAENAFVAVPNEGEISVKWIHAAGSESAIIPAVIERLGSSDQVAICTRESNPVLAPAGMKNFIGRRIQVGALPPFFMGMVNLDGTVLNAGSRQVFEILTEQLITAINVQILYQERLRTEQLNRDLDIAAQVQKNLLPSQLPRLDQYQVSVALTPVAQIGGDFYDAQQRSDGRTGFVVCDVSGKGVPAALLASQLRAMIRAELNASPDPGIALQQVNSKVYEDMKQVERFATAMVAAVDPGDDTLQYASAGHTTSFWVRSSQPTVQLLPSTTLPLGILPDIDGCSESIRMEDGDVLLLYSDGLTEAENEAGRILGMDGVIQVLLATLSAPADFIKTSLIEIADQHRDGAEVADDLTLLVLKKIPTDARTPRFLDRLLLTSLKALPEIGQIMRSLQPELPLNAAYNKWFMETELALSELISNIYIHACGRKEDRVHVVITLYEDSLQIDVIDRGIEFESHAVRPEPPEPELLRAGGYGLSIIYQVMDCVSYQRIDQTYNHWRLIRHLLPDTEFES